MPILAGLAVFAFIVQMVEAVRRRRIAEIWVVQAALAGALVARLLMLSFIDITSFPAVDPLYLTAAYPVLILLVFVALYERERMVLGRGPWWKWTFGPRRSSAPLTGGSAGA
jgi:phosphatidylserine synthase